MGNFISTTEVTPVEQTTEAKIEAKIEATPVLRPAGQMGLLEWADATRRRQTTEETTEETTAETSLEQTAMEEHLDQKKDAPFCSPCREKGIEIRAWQGYCFTCYKERLNTGPLFVEYPGFDNAEVYNQKEYHLALGYYANLHLASLK